MKKTDRLILDTALNLFNTHGLAMVTLRSIALEMGISQGNLNYHFKKREDIIEALYFQLVKNIDARISSAEIKANALETLFDISRTIMTNFYEYRFFLLDFVQIIRENTTIREHYSFLTAQRETQFMQIFQVLVENGTLRCEALPNEYVNVYKRFKILGDFWISSALTEKKPLTTNSIGFYSEIIQQAIYPYLTADGQKVYHSMPPLTLNSQ